MSMKYFYFRIISISAYIGYYICIILISTFFDFLELIFICIFDLYI